MDYRKIYIKIIVNAKKEADKGLRPKRIGDKKYFSTRNYQKFLAKSRGKFFIKIYI